MDDHDADTRHAVFTGAGRRYDRPGKIVALGAYYPQAEAGAARSLLREDRAAYGDPLQDLRRVREGVAWTGTVNALNRGRRWAQRRGFERLDPLLAEGVAIAVVPAHAAYVVDTPIRALARLLAASRGRVDATGCLERHLGIRQILFGGPSTRALHHQTIHVLNPEIVRGKPVLLLDDIAKSGASLMACRELLLEAGAGAVQALALARVVMPEP
jgi:hypothetical protein